MFRLLSVVCILLAPTGCVDAQPVAQQASTDNVTLAALVMETDTIVLAEVVPLTEGRTPATEALTGPINLLDRDAEAAKIREETHGTERAVAPFSITRLRVIETIKGSADAYIFLPTGNPETASAAPTDFNSHTADEFWADSSTGNSAALQTGSTYLIFVDTPHPKARELILSEDDKWLTFVRRVVREEAS